MPNKMSNVSANEILLREGGPWLAYMSLTSSGYNYAKLAGGVADKNSLAGAAAVGFMQATANRMGTPLSDAQVDDILYKMCSEYLAALLSQCRTSHYITRDVNHEEAWGFHNRVFRQAGLGEDAWTLNSVFKVIENPADREAYWQQALAAAGDTSAELSLSARTYAIMRKAYYTGSAEQQMYAKGWLDRIESLETATEVVQVGSQMINSSVDELFKGMSLRLSGAEAPAPALVPSPTPTPAIAVTPAPPQPLPPIPAPPVSNRRRGSGGRGRPSSTTRLGHPDSGHHGGGRSGSGGGHLLTILP